MSMISFDTAMWLLAMQTCAANGSATPACLEPRKQRIVDTGS